MGSLTELVDFAADTWDDNISRLWSCLNSCSEEVRQHRKDGGLQRNSRLLGHSWRESRRDPVVYFSNLWDVGLESLTGEEREDFERQIWGVRNVKIVVLKDPVLPTKAFVPPRTITFGFSYRKRKGDPCCVFRHWLYNYHSGQTDFHAVAIGFVDVNGLWKSYIIIYDSVNHPSEQ